MATCAAPLSDDGQPFLPQMVGKEAFLIDCLLGLAQSAKSIPSKWLYDAAGSELFEAICETAEYYPSRTEAGLLALAAPWLGRTLTRETVLVEFGSGASRKTRMLLDAVPAIGAYVPIDISEAELARASAGIRADYPHLAVHPLAGDFTRPMSLDPAWLKRERLGFFPGSTLGNFTPDEAIAFLTGARDLLGPESRLLLGVDLAKDVETLLAAYDDSAGVTAAFNLNLLGRMNRELGCAIDPDRFQHRALWNGERSRIEMHLVSRCRQMITVDDFCFFLETGESIHTENSHKFEEDILMGIIRSAGWSVAQCWRSRTPSYDLVLLEQA